MLKLKLGCYRVDPVLEVEAVKLREAVAQGPWRPSWPEHRRVEVSSVRAAQRRLPVPTPRGESAGVARRAPPGRTSKPAGAERAMPLARSRRN